MTQDAWQNRLTAVVAGQLRRYRRMRKLSARQVSERCTELGLEIHRQTLADLENGRRASVSLAELLVLAAALEVPPVELAVPLGRAETVEILPGVDLAAWHAARWFRGDAALTIDDDMQPQYEDRGAHTDLPIDAFVAHEGLVKNCLFYDNAAQHMAVMAADAQGDPDHADKVATVIEAMQRFQHERENIRRELVHHRASMRRRGLVLPPLLSELADLDQKLDEVDAELAKELAEDAAAEQQKAAI